MLNRNVIREVVKSLEGNGPWSSLTEVILTPLGSEGARLYIAAKNDRANFLLIVPYHILETALHVFFFIISTEGIRGSTMKPHWM